MTIDDLIEAFKELAHDDPYARLDWNTLLPTPRLKYDDETDAGTALLDDFWEAHQRIEDEYRHSIRVAGCSSPESVGRFQLLLGQAGEHVPPSPHNPGKTQRERFIVEVFLRTGLSDGRLPAGENTIRNAAKAAILCLRMMRGEQPPVVNPDHEEANNNGAAKASPPVFLDIPDPVTPTEVARIAGMHGKKAGESVSALMRKAYAAMTPPRAWKKGKRGKKRSLTISHSQFSEAYPTMPSSKLKNLLTQRGFPNHAANPKPCSKPC